MAAVKKHRVVIVFSGLVALGPPLPEKSAGDGSFTENGPLFGVMPPSGRRLIAFEDTAGNPRRRFSPVHLPVVFTNLKSDGRPPDERHCGFRIWFPIRERMYVYLDSKYEPGTLTYVHDPNYGKPGHPGDPDTPIGGPGSPPIEDFAAIPDMRVISPDHGRLRRGVLDAKASDVSAQVFVPEGTLRAGAEDERKYGRLVTYHPSPAHGHPAHKAVVVPQVRITVEVDDRLEIRTSSLDTGEPLDALSFSVDRDGEIWIACLDICDIRGIIRHLLDPFEPYPPDVRECDIDFARFYDLTIEAPSGIVLPCDDPPNRGERKCYTVTVNPPT